MVIVDGVEMMDVREAAAVAGRTPETVRRWVWTGRIRARKSGNRLLLDRREVLAVVGGSTGGAAGPARSPLTLAEWVGLADARESRGRRGVTASDLVLADRAGRSGADAGR